MENFTPYSSLAGGILLGISASILMYLNGRIAGISGLLVEHLFTLTSFPLVSSRVNTLQQRC
jgi:uncharacterized membrane protein YedE/YeeE